MKLTELAIKRPAATIMVIMFFVVLGLFGYTKIGADLFPKSNTPIVTIVTTYPGAGPEEVENQVVDELEEAVSSLSGLKDCQSWIYEGMALTILEYTMSTDADIAAMDAQKAVDKVMIKLPKDVEKPVVQKIDMNDEPVLTIAVAGDKPLEDIYDIAENTIKDRLENVPGVAAIDIVGGREKQVRVELNRTKMESYGLSANQIVQLLQAENLNIPGGNIKGSRLEFDVRTVGKFKTLEDMKKLPVPLPTGGTVPLRDIADIYQGYAEVDQYSRFTANAGGTSENTGGASGNAGGTNGNSAVAAEKGTEAVGLLIQKQSDASIVDTAKALRAELDQIRPTLPPDVKVMVSDDNSVFVNNSLNDTKRTLLEGILTTGIVLFFFLREWRSLTVVMLAIPTSIIATFMMMFFLGYTFNILSLMGLSLCIGILVDDSIVVLENIHRHIKMGKDSVQAAIDGRQEIGMAAIAITLSDVVVFGPIAFMQGMVGQFFRQFGLTVVVATLFSLFVSFTLTPMLAARLYKNSSQEKGERRVNPLWEWIGRKTTGMGYKIVGIYKGILTWALNNRLKLVVVIVAAILASLTLIPKIGFEFLTQTDQGKFKISVEMPAGTALDVTDQTVRDIEARLEKIPEVSHYFATVGVSSGNITSISSSHLAKIDVTLCPKKERQRTVWQVADELRGWSKDYPGVKLKILEAQMVGLNNFEAPVILEVSGSDNKVLADLATKVKKIVEETPGTSDVGISWKTEAKPEYQVVIDRDKASAMGLTAGEVADALRASVAGAEASKIKINNKDLDIWVQLRGVDRKSITDIENITVANRLGQTFTVKQVADIVPAKGPTELRHSNRQRMISITANYKDASLSDLVNSFEKGIAKLDMPAGYKIEYDGLIKQMNESNSDLGMALGLSLIMVYMILVILYESFLTPLIRMLSLPVGIIGAMVALYLTHNTLNIMSIIGIIMLDGLAAKNGTLLIDYTNTLMSRGMGLREALMEAGTKRLRPIFMTSVTMIFGMLPTALALADGAEIRKGMGIVLVGGLITSTLLTPVLIPVAYTLLDDLKQWLSGKMQKNRSSYGVPK